MKIQLDNKSACCKKCKFWNGYVDHIYADCRRYPPQLYAEGDVSCSSWPNTSAKEWCGEFQTEEEWIVK